jgi:hypothetical protein
VRTAWLVLAFSASRRVTRSRFYTSIVQSACEGELEREKKESDKKIKRNIEREKEKERRREREKE